MASTPYYMTMTVSNETVNIIFARRVLCNTQGVVAHNPDRYFLQFFPKCQRSALFTMHDCLCVKDMLGLILTTTEQKYAAVFSNRIS